MRCAWCNTPRDTRVAPDDELERAARKMDELAAAGHDGIGFGIYNTEPTTHPDFPRFVRRARQAGFRRIEVSTSGMKLADAAYVDELVDAGMTKVILTIVSTEPAESDLLLGVEGATARKMQALSNLSTRPVSVTLGILLLRPALARVEETVRTLEDSFGPDSGFIVNLVPPMCVPFMDERRFEWLWPSHGEIVWATKRARRVAPELTLAGVHLPHCVGTRIAHCTSVPDHPVGDPFAPLSTSRCAGCPPGCPGVAEAYAKRLKGRPLLESLEGEAPQPVDWPALAEFLATPPSQVPSSGLGPVAWQEEVASGARELARLGRSDLGAELAEVAYRPDQVLLSWALGANRLKVSVELQDPTREAFLTGARFAVSYTSDSMTPGEREKAMLERLLNHLEAGHGG